MSFPLHPREKVILGHYTELESTEKVCRRNVKLLIDHSVSFCSPPQPCIPSLLQRMGDTTVLPWAPLSLRCHEGIELAQKCGLCINQGPRQQWLLHPLLCLQSSHLFLTNYHLALSASFFVWTVSEVVETIDLRSIVVNTVFTKSSFLLQDI